MLKVSTCHVSLLIRHTREPRLHGLKNRVCIPQSTHDTAIVVYNSWCQICGLDSRTVLYWSSLSSLELRGSTALGCNAVRRAVEIRTRKGGSYECIAT